MIRGFYIVTGTLSLALGILGIFIPGLPTTPFVLITAALYVKSSPLLYHKLLSNKTTGKYIREYKNGISIKIKLVSIFIMWLMILLTVVFVFSDWKLKTLLIFIGIIGTLVKIGLPEKRDR